jgi:hypothetical protein
MEKEAREAEELFDRAAHVWKMLEEDEKVQQWDQEEETINTDHTRSQAKAENNEHHRALEGHSRQEEDANIVENYADQGKRKGTRRKVPEFGDDSRRSAHHLSGSGQATSS